MEKELICKIIEYIFSNFDLEKFENYTICDIDLKIDDKIEKIKILGYTVIGFTFLLFNTSLLNENNQFELRMIIKFEDNLPYGIIYDGEYKMFIQAGNRWIEANMLSTAGLLVAIERLRNIILPSEIIKNINEELIKDFIINAY